MINGKCSLCGGLVMTPDVWLGTIPPMPTCNSCGATIELPTIQMSPNMQKVGWPVSPSPTSTGYNEEALARVLTKTNGNDKDM